MGDLGAYDAIGLGELVRRRKVSSAELLEDTIRRIEAVNPSLNAVICTLWERARAEARKRTEKGPAPGERFPGVPYLLKDLLTGRNRKSPQGARFQRRTLLQMKRSCPPYRTEIRYWPSCGPQSTR